MSYSLKKNSNIRLYLTLEETSWDKIVKIIYTALFLKNEWQALACFIFPESQGVYVFGGEERAMEEVKI